MSVHHKESDNIKMLQENIKWANRTIVAGYFAIAISVLDIILLVYSISIN